MDPAQILDPEGAQQRPPATVAGGGDRRRLSALDAAFLYF